MNGRYRAARDGLQYIASEASSRESNLRDQEGITPTLWAAFCGHVDVLRVLVSRGGLPGKCDKLGNTALHLAAAGGHVKCVAFLLALNEDVWALNIDSRTPRDLAAAGGGPDGEVALRMLDAAMAREMALDPKKCRTKKDKAQHRAERIATEYRRHQSQAKRDAEEEHRSIMERSNSVFSAYSSEAPPSIRDSDSASMVSNTTSSAGSLWSAVRLHSQRLRRPSSNNNKQTPAPPQSTHASSSSVAAPGTQRNRSYHFKVGSVSSDGSRVARKLPGLASNTEVLYVNGGGGGGNRKNSIMSAVSNGSSLMPPESVTDAFELAEQSLGSEQLVILSSTASHSPDTSDHESDDDVFHDGRHRPSIFERPGFGNMAFRNSLTGMEPSTPQSLLGLDDKHQIMSNWTFKKPTDQTDGGSPTVSQHKDNTSGTPEEYEDEEHTPLHAFLVAWGLPGLTSQLSNLFRDDLESLMMATEDDLLLAGIPMGPRKKLLRAIELRNEALENTPPPEDHETRL